MDDMIKVKKKIKEQEKDVHAMKDVIIKLNELMNRYQLKLGSHAVSVQEDHAIPERIKNSTYINSKSIYLLHALLRAYEEIIDEKNKALGEAELCIKESVQHTALLTQENDDMRAFINNIMEQDGSLYQSMGDQSNSILEENQLLIKEIDCLKVKLRNSRTNDAIKGESLQKLEGKCKLLENDLANALTRNDQLSHSNHDLQQRLLQSVPEEDHNLAIEECTRLFSELKLKQAREIAELKSQKELLNDKNENLSSILATSSQKLKTANSIINNYQSEHQKFKVDLHHNEKSIKKLNSIKRCQEAKIKKLANMCIELVHDRRELLQSVERHRVSMKKANAQLIAKNAALGALSIKAEENRQNFSVEVATLQSQKKTAYNAWKKSSKEAAKLHKKMQDKDESLNLLFKDLQIHFDEEESK